MLTENLRLHLVATLFPSESCVTRTDKLLVRQQLSSSSQRRIVE